MTPLEPTFSQGVSLADAEAAQSGPAQDDGSQFRLGSSVARLARSKTRLLILIAFNLAFVLIIGAFEPGFLDITNMRVVINAMALSAPVAALEALLLAASRFDLAVGGIAALSGIVSGYMMLDWHVPALLAFFLGLLFGALVGLIDGIFIEDIPGQLHHYDAGDVVDNGRHRRWHYPGPGPRRFLLVLSGHRSATVFEVLGLRLLFAVDRRGRRYLVCLPPVWLPRPGHRRRPGGGPPEGYPG